MQYAGKKIYIYIHIYHFSEIKLSKSVTNLEHIYSKINFAVHFSGDHRAMLCGSFELFT